jgi:hypothetical protein
MSDTWAYCGSHTVYDKPEYFFDLEEWRCGDRQMVFVHLLFHKWSPRVLRQALEDWRVFREHVACPLYAMGQDDDDKWAKFVSLFGFKFLADGLACTDGRSRRIFYHAKDCPSAIQTGDLLHSEE